LVNHQIMEIKIAPKRLIGKKVEITILVVVVLLVISSSAMMDPGLAFAAKTGGGGSNDGGGKGGRGHDGAGGGSNNVVGDSGGTGKKVGVADGGGHGLRGSSSSSLISHRESFPHPVFVGKRPIVGGLPHHESFQVGPPHGFDFVHHDDDHSTVVKIVHINRSHSDGTVNWIVLTIDYTSPISGITYQAGERIPLRDFVPTVLPAQAVSAAAAAVATAGGSAAAAAVAH
jgi:hypothetical protein